jgi:hypothetical protein
VREKSGHAIYDGIEKDWNPQAKEDMTGLNKQG